MQLERLLSREGAVLRARRQSLRDGQTSPTSGVLDFEEHALDGEEQGVGLAVLELTSQTVQGIETALQRLRFGDPARYDQGSKPEILEDWTLSTTGHKQIGGAHHVSWIPAGSPGAGQFLEFNNGQYLFERTPQSYIFQINGFLNASSNITGSYVAPPVAGYVRWASPNKDTHKQTKNLSRQVPWMYYSKANQGCCIHIGSSAQRPPNGNTLICADTEGHIFEVTAAGEVVWQYVSPLTSPASSNTNATTGPCTTPSSAPSASQPTIPRWRDAP